MASRWPRSPPFLWSAKVSLNCDQESHPTLKDEYYFLVKTTKDKVKVASYPYRYVPSWKLANKEYQLSYHCLLVLYLETWSDN